MMLHEAVMLEIYRQALSASELASPRCQSRESNTSVAAGDVRCPSNESHCSANDCLTPAPTPTPLPNSPVGLPLTATLAPAAAAALLPQQSAAMAAYLAAAQQNHLLLTNPLAAAASLVQQAASTTSPSTLEEPPALDFSRKRTPSDCEPNASDEDEQQSQRAHSEEATETGDDGNSPLDLSFTRKRPSHADQEAPARKAPRAHDYKSPLPPGTWVPPINPYLAAVAAASSLSPKAPLDWKSSKLAPNEATKALEKMTEMTRLGAVEETSSNQPVSRASATAGVSGNGSAVSTSNRHSAWQSHWLNKGADAAKDVFKCVWCKQSFPTLASLTTHMKETQHCGNSSVTAAATNSVAASTRAASAVNTNTSNTSSSTSSTASSNSGSSSNKSELNMLIKETMPLPRKLVRGQDVWLGKGAEQTRQILKCMWCGQSFRSLAEMTSHMQETQHYTNIISQEQIISWKSNDDKSSERGNAHANGSGNSNSHAATPTAPNSNVSAVLTCKVCEQAFSTLKELSTHMAQQSHYKEAKEISPTASPLSASPVMPASKRGRQAREKRKKSLPVRKLLEMERSSGSHSEFKPGSLDSALKPLRDFAAATKITCEKCGSKIETALFVEHIRKCLGDTIPIPPRRPHGAAGAQQQLNSAGAAERLPSPRTPRSSSSPLCEKSGSVSGGSSCGSVLNALEQLIEKSFETRGRLGNVANSYAEAGTPLGASILKRLGIDDSSDYTKPLMDAQTMQLLRSYSARDRSASESSSASRVESAYTPERQQPTPRRHTPPTATSTSTGNATSLSIKAEPLEAVHNEQQQHLISVKKEFNMQAEQGREPSAATPNPHSPSTAASERSSTSPLAEAGGASGVPLDSSLHALNSMYDQLSALKQETNNNQATAAAVLAAKKPNAHPLAALQKLCETTDTPAANTRSSSAAVSASSSSSASVGASVSGGSNGADLVAFSWACNEAVLSAADSIIKCSFCDTPFCSKGAYRHHLSKVHFVKDEGSDSQSSLKSPAAASAAIVSQSPKRAASRSPAAAQSPSMPPLPQPPTINPYEESPQSKFLKYTELAKQLSSKNA